MSSEAKLPSCIPLPLPDKELEDLVSKTKDWALMHGIGIRSKSNFSEDSLNFAPFSLLPSVFPERIFRAAVQLQTIFNELMHKVAHDQTFLTESLAGLIQVDDFTARLFQIWEEITKEGITQPLSLGLVRNDLMLDSLDSWKQVEFNTIAAGFGWLGPASLAINRFVLEELGHNDKLVNLPDNTALTSIVKGLLKAWEKYDNPKSVILMIIEEVTYNICDQRFHEFELKRLNPACKLIRKTLTQVFAKGKLSQEKELVVDGFTIGVVYYRAGYSPVHYPSDNEWKARLLIERSKAIKCPSIQYHLAGTKKVQQVLTRPGILEKFLSDPEKVAKIRSVFVPIYSLDFNEEGEQAIQTVLKEPERFVLKPQREGGGNNIYGPDVKQALLEMRDSKERTAWIVMEKINPPISKGYIVRPGHSNPPKLVDVVSELGIFGVIIGDGERILVNEQGGHMFRTKIATANEGGVAAGSGALDSPYLINF